MENQAATAEQTRTAPPAPNDPVWSELGAAISALDEEPQEELQVPTDATADEAGTEAEREAKPDDVKADEDAEQDEARAEDKGEPTDEDKAELEKAETDIYGETVPITVKGQRREVTVGELKNLAEEYAHRSRDIAELEQKADSINDMQASLIAERQRISDWLAAEGQAMTPEIRQQISEARTELHQREAQRIIEWRPAWRDPDRFKEDRGAIMERAQLYGFSVQEMESMLDARLVRWIWESVEDRRKLTDGAKKYEALDKMSGEKPSRRAPPKPRNDTDKLVERAKATTNRKAKYQLVGQLLEGL